MKTHIIALSLLLSSTISLASPGDPLVWEDNYLGSSSIWEIHLIKNDGLDTHVKYRCPQLHQCWFEYERLRSRSNNFAFAKSIWMERLTSKILLIK
jgi:hypothetical protein